ncbi:unnamed protein product [Tuber aestivum]|uniref:Nephrocystin 3-like N-terminal domain-containing protein n=1 Tax=Tuber aestivum TaxID=59557 RepID=A0A292Q5J8_9PEZI|nr:unnamed protein product [Tuber aestivum]
MNNSHNQNLFSGNRNSFNVTNSNTNTYHFTTVSNEEQQILLWLSPLESWERHRDFACTRTRGVGKWVLQSSQFRAWQGGGGRSDRVLFCHGAPGAGKTFICSLVIDTLYCRTGCWSWLPLLRLPWAK